MPSLDSWSPKILSLLRFVTGLLFLGHGVQKMFKFPPPLPLPPAAAAAAAAAKAAGAAKAAAAAGAAAVAHAPTLQSTLVKGSGPIELVGGALLVIGLFSRPVAFICSGEMAFAYFMAHAPKSPYPILNGGGEAILYCFVFLYLVFSGPGPYSLDALMKKRA